MNTADIAKTVLERRTRMSPIVFQGEMHEVLGADGLAEALQRRWLIPNQESGYLQVTNDEGVVEEMKKLQENEHLKQYQFKKKGEKDEESESDEDEDESEEEEEEEEETEMIGEDCGESDCPEDEDEDEMGKKERKRAKGEHDRAKADALDDGPMEESLIRRHIANHANRVIGEEMYGGSFMGASSANNATSTPTSTSPSSGQPSPRDVGSEVKVVENGKTFQGKVEAKTDDGKYKVSFGGDRPAQEREYEETELG